MNTLFDRLGQARCPDCSGRSYTALHRPSLLSRSNITSGIRWYASTRTQDVPSRPDFCMPDHNTPTHDQDKPIEDPISKKQVDTLAKNTADFGVTHFAMNTKDNGIITW